MAANNLTQFGVNAQVALIKDRHKKNTLETQNILRIFISGHIRRDSGHLHHHILVRHGGCSSLQWYVLVLTFLRVAYIESTIASMNSDHSHIFYK